MEFVRSLNQGKTISLSSLRRQIHKLALAFIISQKNRKPHSPQQVTAAWWDVEGMVNSVVQAWLQAHDGPDYDRSIPVGPDHQPSTDFILPEWLREHQRTCDHCKQWTSFADYCAHNHVNTCYFSHIFTWLYGNWRFPLWRRPSPGIRDNHASFDWSPVSMQVETDRMLERGHLVEGEPDLIHPSMGVVKLSDIRDRLTALATIGQPSIHTEAHQVDLLNEDLARARASLPPGHPMQPRLKKIKTRYCLDQSLLLNPDTIPIPMECSTVHDAAAELDSNWVMAKLDLERMFNQLGIHRADQPLLGARFKVKGQTVKTFISPRAQFGGMLFPHYASTLMAEVAKILRSYGLKVVFLMDDIFLCAPTRRECEHALRQAISILRRLGWILQDDKIEGPSQELVFLGVLINTRHRRLSIPPERMELIIMAIQEVLSAHSKGLLTFRQLVSLVGRLNWCAEVMIAGRPRVKRIRDCLHQGRWSWRHHRTRRYKGKVTLSAKAIDNLEWWIQAGQAASAADGASPWVPFWSMDRVATCRVFSDASGEGGFGCIVEDVVYHGTWASWTQQYSSGFQELLPILFALQLVGPRWANHVVVFTTDNLGNMFALNKGSSRSQDSFQLIFRIFELAAQYNIYLVADWIPRDYNVFADYVTKVFSPHLL